MKNKNQNKKKFAKKLLHKYRLVILNEDTFEERMSFKLTRLNVFVVVGLSVIFLIMATTVLIAFTPLREYIPGYSSTTLKRQAAGMAYTSDSLQRVIKLNEQYLASIKSVLRGDVETANLSRDSFIENQEGNPDLAEVDPSRADSLLREQVAEEEKYNILVDEDTNIDFSLFPPVKGNISEEYNSEEKHFAVDVVVPRNSPVKSVADGTVIFSEWTTETGYVIIIEHNYGLTSVYKHNASLTKEQGDGVRAGEVVATAGSTGEYTTGPHLHFELWNEGKPVNPVEYIDFD